MALCPACNKEDAILHPIYGITIGESCLSISRGERIRQERSRKGMTAYERMKLGWYRSEKKWHENIRSRSMVKDRSGKQIAVLTNERGEITGRMPEPRGN